MTTKKKAKSVAKPKKKKLKLQPLKIHAKCVLDKPGILKHIKHAMKRGLPSVQPAIAEHTGEVVLVGAGNSVKGFADYVRGHQSARHPIVAVKAAHDWLMEQGIVPDLCIMVDPQENQTRYFQHVNKHTKYLVASQCHPKLFDHFLKQNAKVLIWHCLANAGEKEYLASDKKDGTRRYPGPHILVTGGTTSGLRAICLCYMFGFAHFHLYGFDSCSNTGVSGHVSHEKMIEVFVKDAKGKQESFMTTPAMAKQAEEFHILFQVLPDFKCHIYGHGLIRAVVEEAKRKAIRKENNEDMLPTRDKPKPGVEPVQGDNSKRGTKKARA